MSSEESTRIVIRVQAYGDVCCPWCWMGKRSLEQAAEASNVDLDLTWKPFQLNPEAPVEGEDKMEAMLKKYGEQARTFMVDPNNQIALKARELGLSYRYVEGQKIFNTINVHRLLYYVVLKYGSTMQSNLIEVLFRRYFAEGHNLGPVTEDGDLLAAALEVGLAKTDTLRFLQSGQFTDEIHKELAVSASKVAATPHFFFPHSEVDASGSQTIPALQQFLADEANAMENKV
jgi:predicted DsbA family dithiol-disulfide isomerase